MPSSVEGDGGWAVGCGGDGVVVLVDVVVVAVAEQGGVVEAGCSALCPVDDVVGVGPGGGFRAAGVDAAAVADF